MPEEATLTLEAPPHRAHAEPGDFIRGVCDAVANAEEEARSRNAGKPYLGEARCRGVNPMGEPSMPESGGRRWAGVFIAMDEVSRREVDDALAAFPEAYACSRAEFIGGDRETRWLHGTWYRVAIDLCPCAGARGPAG